MPTVASGDSGKTFWLGTHKAGWLALAGVPLFLSRRVLERVRRLPRAAAPWALDSGGFSELDIHGQWALPAAAYVALVRRFAQEVGSMAWAAPQDWMCEPHIVRNTGLSVEVHQRLTIENFLELVAIAPEIPWVPVLQGWVLSDYWRHVEAYESAGVDLGGRLVGVGSICRRQAGADAALILSSLAGFYGLRLHGFGVKVQGLLAATAALESADSMAWSKKARHSPPILGHTHKSCANCLEYALRWRAGLPPPWGTI
jgi:hypothetical protein